MTEHTRPLGEIERAAGDLLVSPAGDPGMPVGGLAYDSRSVGRGDLFFCVPGAVTDGHAFAAEAQRRGASALVVERPTGTPVPEVRVTDVRRAMGRMAAEFFGHPADDLLLIGITGTNGKTTTAYLIESILTAAGFTSGLIGTIETRVAGVRRPGMRTTPESIDLQRLFADMRSSGVEACVMEVTSHALALHRVEGVRYRAAAFTNLSQDHLDFHADMEAYWAAKRRLFTPERVDSGAVNVDDRYGRELLALRCVPLSGFGVSRDATVRAVEVELAPTGTAFTIVTPEERLPVRSALVGAFNVSNCLAAAATVREVGMGGEAARRGIEALAAVPGRFEAVDCGQPFSVVVDYAHTPDSLDNVLSAARSLAAANDGRVLCVFGCGGDRDRGKRPLMGMVAARRADVVIVTSDNPRSEDPDDIIAAILEGVVAERAGGPDEVLADRRAAIMAALRSARPGDVVVVAGKGHETGQQLGDRVVPFDDRLVAKTILEDLGWGATP
jgi:UDP-N-acetylmuramoyl-L-alanyl-D-glutamate--2,6-diaminopimelate ligase